MRVLVVMISLLSVVISQKNLTPNGIASQNSDWYWTDEDKTMTADLAVTGERTSDILSLSCSVTKPDVKLYDAWWMLTFPVDTVYITNVLIYYRGNTLQRFAGYYLYVSNSNISSKTGGSLCYHHEGSVPTSAYKDVNCNYLGNQVIFYNKRDVNHIPAGYSKIAIVELCHVEVYGCYKGWWDSTCSKPCPATCVDGHCYPGNGSCVWGCNPDNCLSDICDTATGICTQGCEIGISGDYCDKPCDWEKFGNKCAHTCHCIDQPCDPKTGACSDSGCKRGYISFNCSIECSHSSYGYNCNESCDACLSDSCDKEHGVCTDTSGCKPGWQHGETKCDLQCSHGSYGYNCNESCDGCLSDSCDKEHGVCTDTSGCKPGWQHGQTKCDLQCSHGSYGYNCNESCDGCLSDSCDNEHGVCTDTSGCKPGWQHGETKCDLPCEQGQFGYNCTETCHCLNEPCDPTTGECSAGECERGYTNSNCSTECSSSYYGFNCVDKCNKCNSTLCERFEGNCTYGCIEGHTGHQCLFSVHSSQLETEPTSIVPIVGGIGGVVVAIMLVVILVIFIRYRSHSNKTKYRESRHSTHTDIDKNNYVNTDIGSLKGNKQVDYAVASTTTTEDVKIVMSEANTQDRIYTNHVSDEEGGNDECVYSNREDRYRIPVSELQNVINEKQKDDGFLKEYEILPKGLVRPHVEGSKEENKIKNRYLTTWPYDHSRVILQGNTSSDYINANYIDSYGTEKAYIASQGPKKNTIKDFWQMVWQEKADIIVMVTNLEEKRVKKCEQYWPDSTSNPFVTGQFKVSLRQEREHTGHVYRMIGLLNKESKSERTIHHFHFTQWPDHGVPDKIKLVSFYRKVKSTTTCLNGPVVVHCSAGIGRTGTFIAIDALYEHGQETGYIDIMEYVQMMRKDRMNMIQTKEQYATVFEALLEAFTVPDTAIDKDHFCNYLENQQLNITPKNQTFHKLEFQKLKDMKPTYSGVSYKVALSKENAAKNAVQNILPHDDYRPFLMSFEISRNDYINAVIIPGYARTVKFLVTQYPLQDTVVDFWSMVYDTDSTVVVMLEYVDESVPLWPQKGDVFHFSKFNVSLNSDNTSFPLSLTLNHKETNRNITVRILSMDEWNTENVPSSGTCMLNLLNNVSSWRKDHPGSVTVVCQDGCKRSGVFVALSLVLEKIEIDDEVDIFQVVRTIQIRRPEFFPNFNQYEYCYQCIKEHLEGNSLYANV